MKTLITGIGGFVGPYLQRTLESVGHEVFGLERTKKNETKNIFCGDILDPVFVQNTVKQVNPDYIIHLAGFSAVKKSFDESDLCHQINVEGTRNLLDNCLKLKQPPKVLIITSAEVYGVPEFFPITENHPLKPINPYGKSRLNQEKLTENYQNYLNIVITRSFNHTGPGQTPTFVVPNFVKQIVEIEKGYEEPIIYTGNLEAIRDFSDVRDIVKAYILALEKGINGKKYNICSGNGQKISSILNKLLELSKQNIQIKTDPKRLRPSDTPKLIGSHEKFTKRSGWKPQISFEQTLVDMLDWWRFNL